MEDLLEYLLCNTGYTLKNESNQREVNGSLNSEGWCVYEGADLINEILDSENIDKVIKCFNFED
jgi:hypothetical protein